MKAFIINPGMVNDYIYELSSSLHKLDVSVFLLGSSDYKNRIKSFNNFNYYNFLFNVENISSPRLKRLLKGFLYILLHFYILQLIIKERPDIIHFQWFRMPFLDSLFVGIYKRYCPVIYTIHNTTLNHGDKVSFISAQKKGYKNILKKVSSLIVHTNYSKKKFLEEYPEFEAKVKIISHGLLNFPSKGESKKFRFDFGTKVVLLFFGNIQKYKGLDILVEAMQYLRNKDVVLLVAGKANIPIDELKERAKMLNVSHNIYWLTQFIPDEDVQEIYDYSDIVVLPHRHIDQSGVLMSAINFSKPVIASNTGGFSEIVEDGKYGFLFRSEDPLDLANKIEKIIDHQVFKSINFNVNNLRKSWKTWQEISEDTLGIYNHSLNTDYENETK